MPAAAKAEQTLSAAGLRFIAGFEGFSPRLYNDPGGSHGVAGVSCDVAYGRHSGEFCGTSPGGVVHVVDSRFQVSILGGDDENVSGVPAVGCEVLDRPGRRAGRRGGGGRVLAASAAGPGRIGVDDPFLCGRDCVVSSLVPVDRPALACWCRAAGAVHQLVASRRPGSCWGGCCFGCGSAGGPGPGAGAWGSPGQRGANSGARVRGARGHEWRGAGRVAAVGLRTRRRS